MAFAQLMEYTTANPDEVRRVHESWEQSTAGKRNARRSLLMQHHSDPNRFCELVFFDSYDAARENSDLPETDQYAQQMRRLTQGDITYFDLDVVEDRDL